MFPVKQRLSHFFSSIRFRLILLVLLSIIPALGFILYGAIEQRQYNVAAAEKVVDHYVRHIALLQDRLIVQIRELLFALGETAELKNRDAAACSALFAGILKNNQEYSNIGAIDRSGNVFASAVPFSQAVNVADRPYFQRVLQTRQYSVGNYQIGRITGKTGINLAYPILDKSGEVETIVYVLLPIEALKKMAAAEELPAGATLTMIDAHGTILSRNLDSEKWEGKNFPETEIIQRAMAQGKGTTVARGLDGITRLYAFAPLSSIAPVGFVYAGIPIKTVYNQAEKGLIRNLLFLAGLTILALLTAWMFGSLFILRKLAVLVNTAQYIADGHLTARTGLSHEGGEINQVAKSFDQMAETLQQKQAEREQAKESFLRLHRQNQLILDAAGEGIVGLDMTGKVIFINPAVVSMTGYEPGELLGEDLHDRLHYSKPDGAPYSLSECPMHISLVEGKACKVRDEVLWRKDGTSFPTAYSSTPMLEQGEIVGAVVVFRDISERKQAEEERAKLEAQLQQAQKLEAIGTLAGGIAHDFNNILMAIIGYTELAATALSEDSQAYNNLAQVIKAGNRAADLVQQILAFCRQDEGERQVIQVGPILKECLKMLQSTLPTTIEISHKIDGDGIVAANPVQLHQIIMNLCTNAYHAMRDKGGTIEASLTSVTLDSSEANLIFDLPPGTYLQLSIADTGSGMEPTILKRIFDPFFTTKGPGEGTGLGLSVVHGIVKNHGGAIKVYSEPGKGTVFHIFFPQITTEAAVALADQEEKNMPRGTEHILLVDDEEILTTLVSNLLESRGYEVTSFNSAPAALDSFQAHPQGFDLVLTDQTMPQMTGLELASRLLQIRPNLPVILCTGYSLGVSEETVKAAGIRELLMKPIIHQHLAEKIRQVLDQR